jgi:hypothetical protein
VAYYIKGGRVGREKVVSIEREKKRMGLSLADEQVSV